MSKGKRIFDIGFSLLVFVCGWPIFLLLALLIKLTSKGPVFYKSPRVGLNQAPIGCWKFRTMHHKADQLLCDLLAANPSLKSEWESNYKLKDDMRVTKLGKTLRKTSLDELPQFWNVLKGDLSVVGPRPVSSKEADLFLVTIGKEIFSVRPGLTGLWQISGRNNLSYQERMSLEQKYVNTRSFFQDVVIILKTIPMIFFPKGAF